MTPEYLACSTTNSQLEPILRTIQSSVPTRDVPAYVLDKSEAASESGYTGYNRQGQYIKPVRSTTSLENPLFRLTEEEYRTLR